MMTMTGIDDDDVVDDKMVCIGVYNTMTGKFFSLTDWLKVDDDLQGI